MLKPSALRTPEHAREAGVAEARGFRLLASEMIYAAADGDLQAIQRLRALGVGLDASGYDRRTPLHLAAAEGHEKVVRLLIECDIELAPRDRWGRTPEQDARRHGHWRVAKLLEAPRTNIEGEPQRAARRGEVGVFRCIE